MKRNLEDGADIYVLTDAFDDLEDGDKIEAEVNSGGLIDPPDGKLVVKVDNDYQWKMANCFVVDKRYVAVKKN